MTEVRVEHRVFGIIGRLIRDNEVPLVRWEDTGKVTTENWADLLRLQPRECSLSEFDLPAGMYPDSDMGCTE